MTWTYSRRLSTRPARRLTAAQTRSTVKDPRWRLRRRGCCWWQVSPSNVYKLSSIIRFDFQHLLVAGSMYWFSFVLTSPAERRVALKAELDRLKGDPAGQRKTPAPPEPAGLSASKGTITLQEIRLPLKADFVCSTANKPGTHSKFL